MKPLVAVPAYPLPEGRVTHWDGDAVAVPADYLDALRRAGAREAILGPEPVDERDAHELLGRLDGLLLVGGGDLDPAVYGQAAHDRVYGVSGTRDAFELALARAAIERRLPVLAICRGHQVLDVALGGALDQHIAGRDGGVDHGHPGAERGARMHDVAIEPGSRLAEAMGTRRASCSSHHHQAVEHVGAGLAVVARAPDGVVEGLELEEPGTWVVSVQWHPEDTAAVDPAQQRLFDTFVARAGGSR